MDLLKLVSILWTVILMRWLRILLLWGMAVIYLHFVRWIITVILPLAAKVNILTDI